MSQHIKPSPVVSRRTAIAGTIAAIAAFAFVDQLTSSPALASDWVNGQMPASALTTVPGSSGTQRLERSTAAAWLAMVEACRQATGTTMVVTSPDGGYRDLAMQQNLVDNPQGPVGIAGVGRSSHGFGTAVDIWNRQYGWLTTNAVNYGFTQSWDSEPWHWQFNGAAGNEATAKKEEEIMEVVFAAPNGNVIHMAPGVRSTFSSQAEYETFRGEINFLLERGGTNMMQLPAIGAVVGVSWDTYKRLCKYFGVAE